MFVPPADPPVYHILHVDRLQSVLNDGHLLSDAVIAGRGHAGTTIGMSKIKQRRLTELQLNSHPGLYVGQCVPFYFCPRSVMLFLIHRANHPELAYRGGQGPILHLRADLERAVAWATENGRRWAFTLSNAGSYYFEDRADLAHLNEVNWPAIGATRWPAVQEAKQAEFLVEEQFPWTLIDQIGVSSQAMVNQVTALLQGTAHRPQVRICPDWYY